MKITSSYYQLEKIHKQHLWQSFFTLLIFCATLFIHSEHYVSVNTDIITTATPHDCHLCQQSVDTPPNAIALSSYSSAVSVINNFTIVKVMLTAIEHLYPLLRAPPTLSIIL